MCNCAKCTCIPERLPPPVPPKWRHETLVDEYEVQNFLGSLTQEQSAAAKVTFNPSEGLVYPYTVFYPED